MKKRPWLFFFELSNAIEAKICRNNYGLPYVDNLGAAKTYKKQIVPSLLLFIINIHLSYIYISAKMRFFGIIYVTCASLNLLHALKCPAPPTAECINIINEQKQKLGGVSRETLSDNPHPVPDTKPQPQPLLRPTSNYTGCFEPVECGAVSSESRVCSEAALQMMRMRNKKTGKYGNAVDCVSIRRPPIRNLD
jgi:hypothetical protein